MREISFDTIVETVKDLAIQASIDLSPDMEEALTAAWHSEENELGAYALEQIVRNIKVARTERLPICQDTGYFTVFLECGPGVLLPPGTREAVNQGVARATAEAHLRASMVEDPRFHRVNTGDNTPVQLHLEQAGEEGVLRVTVMPKGGGSENATLLSMLLPTAGATVITNRVVEHVTAKAPSACPPVVVGVGLGGSADACLLAAKRALLRPVGEAHREKEYAGMEKEILSAVNRTRIGASGLGGSHTALAVHIETLPTHIANLPLAVVISCHALRKRSKVL
jgi:fumarate hydratase subunit alpha